jgi:GT2 family glycosyltransferase
MTAAVGSGAAPSVSAVVINYNGGERTLRCLEALGRQTTEFEHIVVVDNGSHDGSLERIRALLPHVEIIDVGENKGLPAARNIGLKAVSSEHVLLADSDVYLEPDALCKLLAARAATGATVVCPRIRLIPERDVVQCDGAAPHFIGTMTLLYGYRPVSEVPARRAPVPGCIGACYLLDRRRVLDAGGFDEAYFIYFEDLEFMLRLTAYGHEFVCEPAALAYHERAEGTVGLSFRGTGSYPPRRAYLHMRNRWLTILVHYRLRTLLLLLPVLAAYELAVLALAISRGWGVEWLQGWAWLLRNLPEVLRRRRVAQRTRVRNDRDLLTGGPLPLTPGLIRVPALAAGVAAFSALLNAYWWIARRVVG